MSNRALCCGLWPMILAVSLAAETSTQNNTFTITNPSPNQWNLKLTTTASGVGTLQVGKPQNGNIPAKWSILILPNISNRHGYLNSNSVIPIPAKSTWTLLLLPSPPAGQDQAAKLDLQFTIFDVNNNGRVFHATEPTGGTSVGLSATGYQWGKVGTPPAANSTDSHVVFASKTFTLNAPYPLAVAPAPNPPVVIKKP